MFSQTPPVTSRNISLATIRDAAAIVYEAAVRTPLIRLDLGSKATDAAAQVGSPLEIFLKLETLQPIGSFKIRGAYNAVRQLTADQRAQGVWTVSAGNAAQGVALAARKVGAAASVLVMDTAPATKLRAIERLGARIVQTSYDDCWRTVETHSSEKMQGHFVHPFDDDRFISGNGTIGLEIVEDLPDVDAVIAPLGGGGLLSGVACAVRALRPSARVYAAEPVTAAPLARSLARGPRQPVRPVGGVVRRRRGRTLGARQHVAAAPRLHHRLDRRQPRGGRARDGADRGPRARHRRGCGRLRDRRGAAPGVRPARPSESRRDRVGREHRSVALRKAGGRVRMKTSREGSAWIRM